SGELLAVDGKPHGSDGARLTADGLRSLVEGVRARSPRAIGRAITAVETEGGAAGLLKALFPSTGRSRVVGITGPPGAGKSTLAQRLAQAWRREGKTAGIVPRAPAPPSTTR